MTREAIAEIVYQTTDWEGDEIHAWGTHPTEDIYWVQRNSGEVLWIRGAAIDAVVKDIGQPNPDLRDKGESPK